MYNLKNYSSDFSENAQIYLKTTLIKIQLNNKN